MSALTQLFFRSPKNVGIIQGTPSYEALSNFDEYNNELRNAQYSPNGNYFAFTQPSFVTVVNPNDGSIVSKIELKDCFDIHFSPEGSFISTWEKPVKQESGNYQDNVKIFNVISGELIGQYSSKDQSGWKPDFTADEKIIARIFNNEIRFYEVNKSLNFNKHWSVLKIENVQSFKLSPGKNPTIATFVPDKKGRPANVSVWNITAGIKSPICSKTFFKADSCKLAWNSLGTALLALASTDVDSSNKSYYGENNLYLLGIAGSYDSRITLDKEGPIHDITWSPSAREFGVIYGFMPAQTSFFDARGNLVKTLPPSPRNTILYSPHAKYVLVAGFGNLQGTVDIYDRLDKFNKVATFEASNTSVCQWSPDGRYILTATTSPRLRVDNGIKIWYASGKLVYNRDFKEVNAVTWRPRPLEMFPAIRGLDENPAPHQSAIDYVLANPTKSTAGASKPKGAYRPPHARGNGAAAAPTQSLYQRELNSSMGSLSMNGSSSSIGSTATGAFKARPRERVVPGAQPVVEKESKAAAKNRKKREAKKAAAAAVDPSEKPASPAPKEEEELIAGGVQSLEEKKIRALLKKLRAIEQLKMKQAGGESLEDTQILKIKTEGKVRGELEALGWIEE
ncbi:hypothetical protein WICPIJ_008678 [Wickerhamomyces pijperi]|uniref:Eukaryotic translation initiation factor 2A n=1 Tax=Wickerhamomyces pijperi TaxID=599730 RepID=A0A9P8PXP9_WICPI|nr:hypothetical protein WICPIJ_008678 [Wickerhamomyces pijperi]